MKSSVEKFVFLSNNHGSFFKFLFFNENFEMKNNSFTCLVSSYGYIGREKKKRVIIFFSPLFLPFFQRENLFVRFNPSLPSSRVISWNEQKRIESQVLRSGASQRGPFRSLANRLHKSDDNVYTVLKNLEEAVAYNLFPLNGR